MKKGFTLVELLAVIVILAVILLIAVPAVKKTVDSAKQKTAENNAVMIKNIAEKYYTANLESNEELTGIDLTSNTLSYSGEKPSKGYLYFTEDGIAYGKMYLSGYCIEITSSGESTSTKTSENECDTESIPSTPDTPEVSDTTAPTLEVTTNVVEYTSYTINVTTSDASGIKEIRYYIDGTLVYRGLNKSYSGTTDLWSITYKVESEDNYGNVATTSGTIYVTQCFVAGTKVLTKDGLKNIEDIKIGEYVYAINLDTNEKELSKVTDTIRTQNNKIYEVTLENGEVIKSTEKHEYYVLDKGWTRAYNLKVGDTLSSTIKGKLKIKSIVIKNYDTPVNTYNLTVEGKHNYLITEYEVLVHNVPSPTA